MKEKTLDEIMQRNDYARLTAALRTKVEELAEVVRKKMDCLDLKEDSDYYDGEIEVDGVTLKVQKCYSRSIRDGFDYLAIREGECWNSLESIARTYYYARDFNCEVVGASNKAALRFLNASKNILIALNKLESDRCREIKNALTNN